ncbi:MAG: Flagellar assembly protein FliH [Labilithrix sp.]|nr:Flagellar assembly protein FliH [Labilithrix sp.]
MSLGHARILKASTFDSGASPAPGGSGAPVRDRVVARRIPAAIVDARAEAERILGEARAAAHTLVDDATQAAAEVRERAAREAREAAVAEVVAEHLALRVTEERRAERELDRTIAIAALLAERVVGEALAIDPARIATLAESALSETRGARRLRIEASPADLPALHGMLAGLGDAIATVEPSAELERGSLVVHTELGRIDARLGPQLARLAEALREALREIPGAAR